MNKWLSIVVLFLLLSPQQAGARDVIAGPVAGEVLQVVDGDTFRARVHIWIGQNVETLVRIEGIDTPEKHGKCELERVKAEAARQALEELLSDGPVRLVDIRHEKYAGRVMARALTASGVDVAQVMKDKGHARAYGGGKRAGWCP